MLCTPTNSLLINIIFICSESLWCAVYPGAPSGTRTCNLCLRRATHYPVVLWVRTAIIQLIFYFDNIANIKSSKSPSKTASESVFSTFVRTSLTN